MTRTDNPIRIPGRLHARLDAFCTSTGRAKTKVTAIALERHLDAEEAKDAGREYPRYVYEPFTETPTVKRKK
jgi:hypothetical protein